MIWWTLAALVALDYIYFKFRYTRKNGPPAWYGVPFVGFLPIFLLPKPLFGWAYSWLLNKTPNVFYTRVFGSWVVLKEEAISEMQLNELCDSRPAHPLFDYVASSMANKKHWVFLDGGIPDTADWRDTRKVTLAALYRLSRQEIEDRVLDTVDSFLAEVEMHTGKEWDFSDELVFSKVQEALYFTVGQTIDRKEIAPVVTAIGAYFKYLVVLTSLLQIVPINIIHLLKYVIPKSLNPVVYCRVVSALVERLQQQRVRPENRRDAKDFIEAVMQVKSPEKAQQLIRQVTPGILVGSYHTTSQTTALLVHYLAAYPDYQQRIFKEIKAIVGDGPPTLDHYEKMHFTKAFIAERYRMMPPVSFTIRITTAATTLGGYDIPAGTRLVALFHSETWNPKYFEHPEEFRPERHLNAKGIFVKSPHIDVFSRGRRDCIGRHFAKISVIFYMIRLLQHFEVRRPKDKLIRFAKYDGSPVPSIPHQHVRFIRRDGAPPIRRVELDTTLLQLINKCIKESS